MRIKIYSETIKRIKSAILSSRCKAATLANRELLVLYFNIRKLITKKTKQGKWGDKILDQISFELQKELPGLKRFFSTNIKRMKAFYIVWCSSFVISPSVTDQFATAFVSVSFTHHSEVINI